MSLINDEYMKRERERRIYFEELAHVIVVAEKSEIIRQVRRLEIE